MPSAASINHSGELAGRADGFIALNDPFITANASYSEDTVTTSLSSASITSGSAPVVG